MKRVSNVPRDIREELPPGTWFIDATRTPHSDVQCAMQATFRDPSGKHLHRLVVTLSGWWKDERFHSDG